MRRRPSPPILLTTAPPRVRIDELRTTGRTAKRYHIVNASAKEANKAKKADPCGFQDDFGVCEESEESERSPDHPPLLSLLSHSSQTDEIDANPSTTASFASFASCGEELENAVAPNTQESTLPPESRRKVTDYLARIGESKPEIIAEILSRCAADPAVLAGYLQSADAPSWLTTPPADCYDDADLHLATKKEDAA